MKKIQLRPDTESGRKGVCGRAPGNNGGGTDRPGRVVSGGPVSTYFTECKTGLGRRSTVKSFPQEGISAGTGAAVWPCPSDPAFNYFQLFNYSTLKPVVMNKFHDFPPLRG